MLQSLMKDGAMKDKALLRIAASSLMIAATMTGCSGVTLAGRSADPAEQVERLASAQAQDAEKALRSRNAVRAVQMAEAAVAADPDKAAWRSLLGRAYLLAGRYDSAQAAFRDALTLGSNDARTIVNLALVNTAQGHAEEARSLLADHIEHLSAADYGLAMAMAGDPDEAVRILSQAIHDPAATSKERQNLAYAYALSGRWVEARQMATIDLPPLDAAKRVASWAQTAQSGVESERVVAMIGVQPRGDDAGLPVRLALGAKPQRDVQFAEAAVPVAESAALSMIAAAQEDDVSQAPVPLQFATQRSAAVEAPVREVGTASLGAEAITEATVPAFVARSKPVPVLRTAIPKSRPANAWQPVDAARGSAWVVQLGAFATRDAAQASRGQFMRRNGALQAFPIIDSAVSLHGRSYYRVAVAGFSDRAGADRLCATIKAQGGGCFVRLGGAEAAPSRWAAALQQMKPQQLAMR